MQSFPKTIIHPVHVAIFNELGEVEAQWWYLYHLGGDKNKQHTSTVFVSERVNESSGEIWCLSDGVLCNYVFSQLTTRAIRALLILPVKYLSASHNNWPLHTDRKYMQSETTANTKTHMTGTRDTYRLPWGRRCSGKGSPHSAPAHSSPPYPSWRWTTQEAYRSVKTGPPRTEDKLGQTE